MGNEESLNTQDILPVSPLIQNLRNTLRMNIQNNRTSSFVSGSFAQQIKKTSGQISRLANPFCPIIVQIKKKEQNQQWMSCCLISPIMAIASPLHLVDQKSIYCVKARIQGINKMNKIKQIMIKKVQVIEQMSICLMLLETPIIDLGWAGVSCIIDQQKINNQPHKIINHPRIEIDEKSKLNIYHQQITKAFYKLEEQFVGSFKAMPGSLIFKIIQKKPYIIGIQVNQKQGYFFNQQILQKIQQVAKLLIDNKKQMEILKHMDIQELQLMGKI